MTTLLELDQQEDQTLFYSAAGLSDGVTTIGAGIWRYRTTITGPAYGADFDSDDYAGTDDPFNTTKLQVGSVVVDNTDYTEVSDFADLVSQNQSFLWVPSIQTIYIHFDNFDPYYVFDVIKIGYVLGFSHTSDTSGYSTEDGVYYAPQLLKAPIIKQRADFLFFGLLQNPNSTATLQNDADNSLDDIFNLITVGNPCRLKILEDGDTFADAETVFTGRVKNVPSITESAVQIQLQSERAFLTKKIPFTIYNTTDYPNLNEDDIGKPIPIIFGKVLSVPAVNTESESSLTNYTYKVATNDFNGTTYNLSSIDAVYVDGIKKTPVSTNAAAGEFELAATVVKDGDSFFEVTADVTGYSGDNALQVIRIILDEFTDKEYIAANYNLTQWADAESQVADIGIAIGTNEKETVQSVIEKISATVQGNFLIQGDGKFTFLFQDEDRLPKAMILRREQLSPPEIRYNSEEYLSTATAKYAKKYSSNTYRKYEDDSLEDTVLSNYRIDKNREFETLLTNATDAQSFAEDIMSKSSIIPPRFPVRVNLQEFKDLNFYDNIYLEMNRADKTFYGFLRGVITDIQKDYNTEQIVMSVKWKSDATFEDGVVTSDFIILDGGTASTDYDLKLEYSETGNFTLEGDY